MSSAPKGCRLLSHFVIRIFLNTNSNVGAIEDYDALAGGCRGRHECGGLSGWIGIGPEIASGSGRRELGEGGSQLNRQLGILALRKGIDRVRLNGREEAWAFAVWRAARQAGSVREREDVREGSRRADRGWPGRVDRREASQGSGREYFSWKQPSELRWRCRCRFRRGLICSAERLREVVRVLPGGVGVAVHALFAGASMGALTVAAIVEGRRH